MCEVKPCWTGRLSWSANHQATYGRSRQHQFFGLRGTVQWRHTWIYTSKGLLSTPSLLLHRNPPVQKNKQEIIQKNIPVRREEIVSKKVTCVVITCIILIFFYCLFWPDDWSPIKPQVQMVEQYGPPLTRKWKMHEKRYHLGLRWPKWYYNTMYSCLSYPINCTWIPSSRSLRASLSAFNSEEVVSV